MDNDLVYIYERLKNQYDLELSNDHGQIFLSGESDLGTFRLFPNLGEFIFEVKFPHHSAPKSFLSKIFWEDGTHWHPISRDEALKNVIDFMEERIKL